MELRHGLFKTPVVNFVDKTLLQQLKQYAIIILDMGLGLTLDYNVYYFIILISTSYIH